MSAGVTGLHSPAKPVTETPEILGPGENRMRVPAEEGKKKKKDMDNKKQQQIPVANANYVVVAAKKLVTQSQRQRQRLRLQSTKPVVGSKKEDVSSTTDSISSSSDCSSIDGMPTPAPVVGQGLTTSKKKNGTSVQNAAKVVPVVGRFQILKVSPILVPGPLKRCDWITLNSACRTRVTALCNSTYPKYISPPPILRLCPL